VDEAMKRMRETAGEAFAAEEMLISFLESNGLLISAE
jgi:hypothetical protein